MTYYLLDPATNSPVPFVDVTLVNGQVVISHASGFNFSSIVTLAQFTANQDNLSISGLATTSIVRMSSDAGRNLTGIAGGSGAQTLFVHNVGSFGIVLKNADTNSLAQNRFLMSGDITLASNTTVLLQYDSTSSRWRVIGSSSSSGGVSDGDKGDITISSSGAVYTIDDGVVTVPKLNSSVIGLILALG